MEKEHYLQALLNELKLSAKSFAESLGISRTDKIYHVLKGRNGISPNLAKNIVKKYPDVNYEWLISGKGKMLKSEIATSEQSDYPAKPFVDLAYTVCGKPGGFDVQIMERDCEKLHIPFATNYDFSIRAKGTSMINRREPHLSIRPGDILSCKIVKSFGEVRMGEVYTLAYDGDIITKKLAPSEKEGHVKCISFNIEDGFLPFDIPINEIYGWAAVKCVASISLW